MKIYFCWITALLPEYQDKLVAGLARKGYMVGPAAKDGNVITATHEDAPSYLFALSLYRATEVNINQIYDDLLIVLNGMKARYFSVIVAQAAAEANWIGSNIHLPSQEVSPPKKNMN